MWYWSALYSCLVGSSQLLKKFVCVVKIAKIPSEIDNQEVICASEVKGNNEINMG